MRDNPRNALAALRLTDEEIRDDGDIFFDVFKEQETGCPGYG